MSFNYDQTDIHLNYDTARKLPGETLKLWMDTISKYVHRDSIKIIVDLGCGTARFTAALSSHFSARVYGIEPSRNMLMEAKKSIASPLIEFVQGSAEEIPLGNGVADLIFLSMVYHHIQEKTRAVCEFKRILNKEGMLCIRTSTSDGMDSYLWVRFFPDARQIELARAPSRKGIIAFLRSKGFELHKHAIVPQLFTENYQHYFQKISLRGLSSLKVITDEQFQDGLRNLEKYCIERESEEAIYEDTDLFIFRIM